MSGSSSTHQAGGRQAAQWGLTLESQFSKGQSLIFIQYHPNIFSQGQIQIMYRLKRCTK